MKKLAKRFLSSVLIAVMVLSLFGNLSGQAKAAKPAIGYYRITYSNDGVNSITNLPSPNYVDVPMGTTFSIPSSFANNPPKRLGYRFDGFYESSNPSKIVKPGQVIIPNVQKNYTILIKWTKLPKCNITFVKTGTSVGATNWPSNTSVENGSTYKIPKPTKTGFVCTGFKDQNNKVYKIGSTYTITSDLKLTAVWANATFVSRIEEPQYYPDNIINTCRNYSYTKPVTNDDLTFTVSGWAIHDRGIKSYKYILTGDGVSQSGEVYAYYRHEGTLIAEFDRLKAAGTIHRSNYVTQTGFSVHIPITDLKPGSYSVLIVGKTDYGEEFNITRVSFEKAPKLCYVTITGDDPEDSWTRGYFEGTTAKLSDLTKLVTAKSPFGYYPKWYDEVTNKPLDSTFVVTKDMNITYYDERYSAKITLNGVPGKQAKTVTAYSGETLDQILKRAYGITVPTKQGMLFVGWGPKDNDFKEEILQPHHTFFFDKNTQPITLYALFIPVNQNAPLRYRMNYEDVKKERTAFKSIKTVLENKKKDKSIWDTLNSITVGAISVFSAIHAVNGKEVGVAIVAAFGWFVGDILLDSTSSTEQELLYIRAKEEYELLDGLCFVLNPDPKNESLDINASEVTVLYEIKYDSSNTNTKPLPSDPETKRKLSNYSVVYK